MHIITGRSGYKDKTGESIYFKEPYFDAGLRRQFNSAREKAEFMNRNNIVSNGDSDAKAARDKREAKEKVAYLQSKEKRK